MPVVLLAAGLIWYEYCRSPHWTGVLVPIGQPVLFSHRHHAGQLKIDCRYCHTSVEKSSFAGLPPTETCMTCHSQIFTDSPLLQPVRNSYASGRPIRWNRVHNLPDYVYFDHAIHVNKGIGCATCHGQVNEMPLVWKTQTLFMEWCLGCHRQPEANLRPNPEVFNLNWQPPKDQPQAGAKLAKGYHLDAPHLTSPTARSATTDQPITMTTPSSIEVLQGKLAGKTRPLLWRSLEELAGTPEFRAWLEREFPAGASEWSEADVIGRRKFLGLLGASLALAGLSCNTSVPSARTSGEGQ